MRITLLDVQTFKYIRKLSTVGKVVCHPQSLNRSSLVNQYQPNTSPDALVACIQQVHLVSLCELLWHRTAKYRIIRITGVTCCTMVKYDQRDGAPLTWFTLWIFKVSYFRHVHRFLLLVICFHVLIMCKPIWHEHMSDHSWLKHCLPCSLNAVRMKSLQYRQCHGASSTEFTVI